MPYRLSPSSIGLFKDCPRCFWLDLKKGIKRPRGAFPSLPGGMDRVLKSYFDDCLKKKELPKELSDLKGVTLFDDESLLKQWRSNAKGVSWKDEKENITKGALDAVLKKGKKLIVLDFKTRGAPAKDETVDYYRNQLDIYTYLLRKNGYETEEYSYLLFYHPERVDKRGNIMFNTELVKVDVSIKNAEQLIKEAIKTLDGVMPQASEKCEYCSFAHKNTGQLDTTHLVSSKTPFTNKIQFTNLLKSFEGCIYWLDKYFSQKGLELLAQTIDNKKVVEIKIITSVDKVDESFRHLFKDFREEMAQKSISAELRVITDSKTKASIHDRFMVSKYEAFNVPSPDIIARGQLSEIKMSEHYDVLSKEFLEVWEKSKDIIQDWNTIKECIQKIQKHYS